jgi:hypothetical protein
MAKTVSLRADDVDTSRRTATSQRGAEPPSRVPSADLIPMQFRMDPTFATEFRVEAAKRGMKYNELLKAAFKHYVAEVS